MQDRQETIRITNIQRFCLSDGPGIRTTVFLKGCTLKCPWCANPENISTDMEPYYDKDGYWIGNYGYDIKLEALLEELLKDKIYFKEGGGITFSGGEPLIQIEKYIPLLKDLSDMGIHIAVETALQVAPQKVFMCLNEFDLFIVDIKYLIAEMHKNISKYDLNIYLKNIQLLLKHNKKVWFRFPAIQNYTLISQNVDSVCEFLSQISYEKFQILKGHNLGMKKYQSLNRTPIEIQEADLEYLIMKCKEYELCYEILTI